MYFSVSPRNVYNAKLPEGWNMNYPLRKLLGFALIFLAFTGCKLQIDVPAGGKVISESGSYECDSGRACTIDVYDVSFDETFVAVPDQGYSFAGWKKREKGLCGGKDQPCHLPTTGFLAYDLLMEILESDTVFYLTPEFGRGRNRCSFEFQEIDDAQLAATYVTREVTTGPPCEGRTIGIGNAGNYSAQYSLDGGPWTDDQSDIQPGQTIRVRLASAATFDTTNNALLTIGNPRCYEFFGGCLWLLQGGSSEIKVTTKSGDPADAPQVIVTYPMDGQELNTSVLHVTGTATDDDGVQEILVNGVRASSFDGFLTWEADVQLRTGPNSLVIESADKFLNRNPQAALLNIENTRIVFNKARAIAMKNDSGHLYVVDRETGDVVAVDTQTDEWSIVSSHQDNQVTFKDPRKILVDEAQTRAWILDRSYTDIIAVNLLTGDRTLLKGEGESLEEMEDLTLDEENQQLLGLLEERSPGGGLSSYGIVSIDLETGERRKLSDNTILTEEPRFSATYSILYDNVGDQLIVLQQHGILSVDPVLGQRQTLLEYSYLRPGAAAIDEAGGRIIVGRSEWNQPIFEFAEVGLASGALEPILTGDHFIPASLGIAFDSRENRLFYTNRGHVGTVDLDTGKITPYYY